MGWEEIFLSRLNVGWKLKNFDTCSRHCPDLKLGPNIMFDGSKFSSGCGLQLCIHGRTLSDPSKWSKKAGEGIFPPKLRGSEMWFKHVPDTVPTSNVDQFLSLMAEIVPLDVNSNFGFMVECSRITLDGRKWAGKRFCPETLGWAKWGS